MLKHILKTRGILVILFANISFFINAQVQDSSHAIIGDEYLKCFVEFYGKDPDSVLHYLDLASAEYKAGQFWSKYIESLNGYSSFYANIDSFDLYEQYSNIALKECKNHLNESDLMYSITLGNNAFALVYTGNFRQAIHYFKDGLEVERIHKDTLYMGASLKNIGDVYNAMGDTDQALKYYHEWIALIEENNDSASQNSIASVYRKMGLAYYSNQEFDLSLKCLQKARSLIKQNPGMSKYLEYNTSININYEIAKIYLERNDVDSLKYWINKSFQLCIGDFENKKKTGHLFFGKYYLKNEMYDAALDHLLLSDSLNAIQYKDFEKHRTFSDIKNLLAECYSQKGEFNEAIRLFKESIENLKNLPTKDESFEVPTETHISDPLKAIDAYKGMGESYARLFLQTEDSKHLETSYTCYDKAATLIPEVRNSFQQKSSLLRYSKVAISIYEKNISSALQMYKHTNDQQYLVKAFQYNAKSKAILLLESINKSSAIQLGNIPDSLLQKEKALKLQISSINRKLYDLENTLNNPNTSKIEKYKRQLFTDTEEYDALIRTFEKEYPRYYELKHNDVAIDIRDIQQRLKPTKSQLIEFFFGDNAAYVFSISNDKIDINTFVINDSLREDIQITKNFLSVPPMGSSLKTDYKRYVKSSKKVFDNFIKKSIFPESEHLVFILDGVLGYLPLEALIIKEPESKVVSYSSKNLSYLIEKYDVSYSYSSTLFLNSFGVSQKKNRRTFFGIAPSFDLLNGKKKKRVCNENELYSLQCSEDEVLQIKKKLGGKVLLGKEATLEKTKQELANSRIIHLATHACLDDQNPEFNKIYLSDDYLSNNDLYNLNLNSELAVLSACETGSGQLARGEGVMSLARGFIHAGCPSIIMSLWSIDDCATSKIMVDFYNELYKGQTKTTALRKAKLKYIQEAKRANQHPYYWAAFVQIGNYDPIEISSWNSYFTYAFILLAFVFLIFLRIKK